MNSNNVDVIERRSAIRAQTPHSARPASRRRRLARRLVIASVALLLLGGVARLTLPQLGSWYVRSRILPLVGQRLNRQVRVSHLEVSLGKLSLQGVELVSAQDTPELPLASIGRVNIEYDVVPLLHGRLVARKALAEGVAIRLLRRRDGSSNFLDLVSRKKLSGGSGRLRVDELVVRDGTLTARDEGQGLSLSAKSFAAQMQSGGESKLILEGVSLSSARIGNRLTLARLDVSLRYQAGQLVELPSAQLAGGRIRLLPHLELSGIRGSIGPQSGHIAISLEGSYGGSETKLWSASGRIEPMARTGVLKVTAARFSLGRIASILGRTPVILPERTMIDATLDLEFARDTLQFGGHLDVADLSLFHPSLARTPVLGLAGAARLKGRWELGADKLVLEQLDLSSKRLELKLTGLAERMSSQPHLAARLLVPPVACQDVLSSFPPSLLPQLQGFELKGTFAVDLHADVDYAQLDKVELGGSVGINRCQVVRAPEEMDAARLKEPFEHQVEPVPGSLQNLTVGPENQDFVPYAEISKHMVNAVLTTEDAGFFKHRGFIPSQFRAALSRNLQKGGFRLGASTISMQLVKNVMLSGEKTLSRKLQELFLTWYVEQHLSKERMMEIYLNVIEFGPGIYGVGAAARHYFAKPAKELTPLQAAFFASLLPSPKRRYTQYCLGALSTQWERYVRRLLSRIAEKGHVDSQALAASASESISFARDTSTLSVEDCQAQLKELLDSWQEEERRRLREAILQAAPNQLDFYLKPVADGDQPPTR